MSETPNSGPSPRTLLSLVFGGLLLWGVYVAVGVWWKGLNPLGALVVLVCVGFFLGFWWLLLRTKRPDRSNDS